jgi:hypothetical protein
MKALTERVLEDCDDGSGRGTRDCDLFFELVSSILHAVAGLASLRSDMDTVRRVALQPTQAVAFMEMLTQKARPR